MENLPPIEDKNSVSRGSGEAAPNKKRRKWPFLVLFIILIAGSATAWLLVSKKDTAKTSEMSSTSSTSSQPTTPVPENVVYAFREKESEPFTLYWRPANGGNRTEATKLPQKVFPTYYRVHNQQVALTATVGAGSSYEVSIWYSSNSGLNYEKIYSAPNADPNNLDEQITSVVFANDGKSLLFGRLPGNRSGNSITELSLSGDHATKELFKSDKAGVFLKLYNPTNSTVVYTEGCYNCDGNRELPVVVRNLKTGEVKKYLESEAGQPVYGYEVVASDASLMIYAIGPLSDTGLGSKAPYKISTLDFSSGKSMTITTSSDKVNLVQLGFLAGKKNYFYSLDNQLYVEAKPQPSLLFEANKLIWQAYYVSDSMVIARTRDLSSTDFTVYNYNLKDKSSKAILEGDNNTYIFGVTTK